MESSALQMNIITVLKALALLHLHNKKSQMNATLFLHQCNSTNLCVALIWNWCNRAEILCIWEAFHVKQVIVLNTALSNRTCITCAFAPQIKGWVFYSVISNYSLTSAFSPNHHSCLCQQAEYNKARRAHYLLIPYWITCCSFLLTSLMFCGPKSSS